MKMLMVTCFNSLLVPVKLPKSSLKHSDINLTYKRDGGVFYRGAARSWFRSADLASP